MILSLIVVILVGAIAYFHYVQGFFSATLSAILAMLAAVVAMSYQEPLVRALLQGKIADQANALMLVALFVAVYGLLRVIFDKAIPGNIRLPVLLDKVGAGVMGAVAGCFAAGIFVIAAQLLPFGPSIAGYARYELADRQDVRLPTQRQSVDAFAYDVLNVEKYTPGNSSSLLIPADNFVVGLTDHLSAGGSLAGANSMQAVHPAYLDELFFQRLGIQTGAKRVAYNMAVDRQVELRGLYTIDAIAQAEGESPYVRTPGNYPKPLQSTREGFVLIARLKLSRNASDKDNNVRISPAAVRLVANEKNFYPVGTLDVSPSPLLRVNRPDDFLLVPGDGSVDFVYQVPADDLGLSVDPKNKSGPLTIGPGVFIEAKRLADIDLSEHEVKREVPPALKESESIIRKKDLPPPKGPSGSAAAAATDVPFEFGSLQVSPQFYSRINVGRFDGEGGKVSFDSSTATIRGKRFGQLDLHPTRSIKMLQEGDFQIGELWVPAGQRAVQVTGTPPSKTTNSWEWADKLGRFELVDANGASFKPRGAWAKIKDGPSDRLSARYNSDSPITDLPRSQGYPTDVWIVFLVPEKTALRELRLEGKRVTSLSQQVD